MAKLNTEFLSKPAGPLPVGGWIAVVGAGLAFSVWKRRQTPTVTASPDSGFTDDTMGNPLQMLGLLEALNRGGSGPDMQNISDNTSWYQQAVRMLLGRGNNPSLVDAALRKYMNGQALNAAENAIIELALQLVGPLPHPPPPPDTTPGPEQPVDETPTDNPWRSLKDYVARTWSGDFKNWDENTARHMDNAALINNALITYRAWESSTDPHGFAQIIGTTTGISRPFPWLNEVVRRYAAGTLTQEDLTGPLIQPGEGWNFTGQAVNQFNLNPQDLADMLNSLDYHDSPSFKPYKA